MFHHAVSTRVSTDLAQRIKHEARRHGFDLVGITDSRPSEYADHFRQWLASGFEGVMTYLRRNVERRVNPSSVLPECRSIVVLGMHYCPPRETGGGSEGALPTARISSYAWGDDYHQVFERKLKALLHAIQQWKPACQGRWYVDHGPVLERELGQRAGLGWIGKNTCLMNKHKGSYFFLGVMLLSLELPADAPADEHCGTCRRCLDACPTNALVAPYQLDARRCISYLTIEKRDRLTDCERDWIGDWVFGCDICQQVCPWNRKAPEHVNTHFLPRPLLPDLVQLAGLDEEQFQRQFRDSPLQRIKRRGLARNALIALGNQRSRAGVPAAVRALDDPDPVVREQAAHTLNRIGPAHG